MSKTETTTGGREATGGVIPGRWVISVGKPDTPAPEGFEWKLLTDLARLESGHTPSRNRKDYWNGTIPWIGVRDATGNHGLEIHATRETVTQAGIDNSSARVLPAGTVCLSRTASVGFVVMMGRPMATSQDFVNWVCGSELNARYLKYILQLEQDSIRRFAHGTTHQTMYYPEAKALHVCVPSRAQQDQISEVLGALDDLIEVNRGLMRDLDALRQAASASLLAQANASVPLSSVARFVNGKNFTKDAAGSGRPVIRTPELRQGPNGGTVWNDIETTDDFLAKAGDMLFVWSGSLMIDRWIHEEGLVNQHIFKVVPQPGIPDWLVYSQIEHQMPWFLGLAADKATTMGHIQRGHLDADVPMPSAVALAGAAAGIAPLWDAQLQLSLENRELERTRDELLPHLMSGRVRVAEAVAASA